MYKFLIKSVENDRIYLNCKIQDTLSDSDVLHNINAIIDTGAMTSAISRNKAEELCLLPLGKTYMRDVIGDGETNDYYLNIHIENFVVENLKVGTFPNLLVDFVIGMDILGKGCFSFKNSGEEFVFLFRISNSALLDLNIRNKALRRKCIIEQSWINILDDECEKDEDCTIGEFFVNCIDSLIQQIQFTQKTKDKVKYWKSKKLCGYIVHLLRLLIEPDEAIWKIENISSNLEELVIQPLLEFCLIKKEYLDESYLSYQYAISDNGAKFLKRLIDKFGEINANDYLN